MFRAGQCFAPESASGILCAAAIGGIVTQFQMPEPVHAGISATWRRKRLRNAILSLSMAAAMLVAPPAVAAETNASGDFAIDGSALGLLWVVPFLGILLSIAVVPLAAPRFWHHHFGKISAFWALAFLVPFAAQFGFATAVFEVAHTFLLEYLPFIVLLFALYAVSGGVRVVGRIRPSPAVNTGILAIGMAAASIMGTTGAAMLLIRPLLDANAGRRHNVHVVVFFIFLVANIGGSLTPLGDPPLFLGFLKGVDFFWPTKHMLAPMLLVGGVLLAAFFLLDRHYFAREGGGTGASVAEAAPGLAVEGIHNIALLIVIAGVVLMSGIWRPDMGVILYHVRVDFQDLLRDGLLIAIAVVSILSTRTESRAAHGFTWFPMVEVAKLFAGIFITIVPAIAILRAGESGALGFLVLSLSHNGEPVHALYFWVTGGLSSFLDNAPTYLVFFNMAGGDPQHLMGQEAATLLAISAGAVFMGAMSYIGNAPNFMVRSIAAERGVAMPSFFGYMGWSLAFLVPVFGLATAVFFL